MSLSIPEPSVSDASQAHDSFHIPPIGMGKETEEYKAYYYRKFHNDVLRVNDTAIKCCPQLARIVTWLKLDENTQREIVSGIVDTLMSSLERLDVENLPQRKLDNMIRLMLFCRAGPDLATLQATHKELLSSQKQIPNVTKPAPKRSKPHDNLLRKAVEKSYAAKSKV